MDAVQSEMEDYTFVNITIITKDLMTDFKIY